MSGQYLNMGTHVVLEHAVFSRSFVRGRYVIVVTVNRRKPKMQTPFETIAKTVGIGIMSVFISR